MSGPDDLATPFGEPVAEIPLPSAPLVAVVAQIRFPPIVSIAREDFIGAFQERIRENYPVLRKERQVNVILTPDGASSGDGNGTVWRFLDRPVDPGWTVSLASSFVALDTSEYRNRFGFLERLREILEALSATIRPATHDRVGIRYVDRVLLDEIYGDLSDLVRREVVGVATVAPGGGADLSYSLSDTEFRLGDATLHGRWGRVPPGAQLDPLHGTSTDSPSWLLDLDMYDNGAGEFDVHRLMATLERFAEVIYRFFRWAVRPRLLRHYGGEV